MAVRRYMLRFDTSKRTSCFVTSACRNTLQKASQEVGASRGMQETSELHGKTTPRRLRHGERGCTLRGTAARRRDGPASAAKEALPGESARYRVSSGKALGFLELLVGWTD